MSFRFLLLLSVLGLSAQAFAHPLHLSVASVQGTSPSPCVFPDGSSAPDELHCIDPAHFMQAYGIDKLHAMGLTGKGQTIVLVDSYGSPTLQADLDHFSDVFGLPRTKIEFIYPDGTYANPMQTTDEQGWAGETTLDLEWAHAIAPDAHLVNVVSNSDETVGMAGMQDLFNGMKMAAAKYPGAVISMSFAAGEATFAPSDVTTYLHGSLHQIFADATAHDVTLLAGAGDQGSVNTNITQTGFDSFASTNYPASDPLVTAVGGTALEDGWVWTPQGTADDYWNCQLSSQGVCSMDFLASSAAPGTRLESVWKEDWAVAGGGGGISRVFATPDFQAGLPSVVAAQAQGFRTLPDLSMNAAINGGVEVYSSYAPAGQAAQPQWQTIGGTSCATPETAALVALAAQKASADLGKPVGIGELNSILYQLPSADFNDIVSQRFGAQKQVLIDNNALYFNQSLYEAEVASHMKPSVPPIAVPGFETTPGYDMATGLGSPKAESFVLDVAAARVAREKAQLP